MGFEFVEIDDIPFKIDSATASPVSRLIPSDDRKSVIERPLSKSERIWYLDRAETNACLITEETALRLASELA